MPQRIRVPNGPVVRAERILTVVDRPHRIAHDMQAIYDDAPGFGTRVDVTIEAVPGGHRIRLVRQGFPTVESRDDFAGAWPDVLAELGPAGFGCGRWERIGGRLLPSGA